VLSWRASYLLIMKLSPPQAHRILALTTLIGFTALQAIAQGGAPSSIQIFMPGGGLPDRPIRFELSRDDGRIETVFTDNKGKFLITGDLVRDADFVVRIQGDGRSFASTTVTFRTFRNIVTYVPVFLNPLEGARRPASAVLNVIDVNVPADARSSYEQAMDALSRKETQVAIDRLKKALASYPKYVRALNDLGVIYLQNGQLSEAIATFRQAIKINESFVYPRLNLGVALIRLGKYAEAVDVLGRLYQETTLPLARLPYAEALSETGHFSDAERILLAVCDDVNTADSIHAEARFRLGAIFNKQNRFVDAIRQFEEALKLQPDMVMAHVQLGGALLQLKQLAAAERELKKAYELGGDSAGAAQLLLGETYHLQGKYGLAIQAFEQYLKDVPNAPNAAQVKEAIDRMKTALNKR
jgi:tetratricopeptide (TPR) repeat protein